MKLIAYIHRTCPYSRKLLNLLKDIKLADFTEVVEVDRAPFETYRMGVLSVPALFADDMMIVSGAFDEKWLTGFLQSFDPVLPDEETLFHGFIDSIIDNIATTSYLYLYEDIGAVFENPEYLIATGGFQKILYTDREDFLDYLYKIVEKKFNDFYENKIHLFYKVIAINFLRELYWMYGEQLKWDKIEKIHNSESFAHWLYVRAALGRIGIPTDIDILILMDKSEKVWNYLSQNFDDLWNKAKSTA